MKRKDRSPVGLADPKLSFRLPKHAMSRKTHYLSRNAVFNSSQACFIPRRWSSLADRLILMLAMGTLASILPLAEAKSDTTPDHLIAVEKEFGQGAVYQKLWQQKLLVTPGDVAQFVHLPGNVGEEAAVSIYRNLSRKNGKYGGYWLTVTQASDWLWKCVPGAVEHPIDPRAVAVRRCDIPLPESTALVVRKVWLAMLLAVRPYPASDATSLDRSSEIFFATNSDGSVLRGQIPARSLTKNNSALFHIANLLAGYCDVPASQHAKYAREIEDAASTLLKKVARR